MSRVKTATMIENTRNCLSAIQRVFRRQANSRRNQQATKGEYGRQRRKRAIGHGSKSRRCGSGWKPWCASSGACRTRTCRYSAHLRGPTQIDMRVVSRLFEGKDGLEREALFYPVFETVPKTDMLHMTYCLLLTPARGGTQFRCPAERTGEIRGRVDVKPTEVGTRRN